MKKVLLVILLLVCIGYSVNTNEEHDSNSTSEYLDYFYAEKQKKCIKEALYHEARGEGEEGLRHVLSVIYNRVHAKGFPESYCKVIWQPKQFSYRNGVQPGVFIDLKPVKANDKIAYDLISTLAEDAAYGRFRPSLSPDVLWYHADHVRPSWAGVMKKVKKVGKHSFLARLKRSENEEFRI